MKSATVHKRGFTLVEVMVTVTIFTLVIAQVSGVFVSIVRMINMTMANTEMSLRARQLRDRVLFQSAPSHDNKWFSGLKNCVGLTVDSASINGSVVALNRNGQGEADTAALRLRMETSGDVSYLYNDSDRTNEKWFCPGEFTFVDGTRWYDVVDTGDLETKNRLYLSLTLKSSHMGMDAVTRTERIVMPVAGKYHLMESNGL